MNKAIQVFLDTIDVEEFAIIIANIAISEADRINKDISGSRKVVDLDKKQAKAILTYLKTEVCKGES